MDIFDYISGNKNDYEGRLNKDVFEDMKNENIVKYIVNAYRSLEIIKGVKFLGSELIEDETLIDQDVINRKYLKGKIDKGIERRIPINQSRLNLHKAYFQFTIDPDPKDTPDKYTSTHGYNNENIKVVVLKTQDNWSFGGLTKSGRIIPNYKVPDGIIRQQNKLLDQTMRFDRKYPVTFQKLDNGDILRFDIIYVLELLIPKRVNKYYYMLNGTRYYPIYQIIDASTYNFKEKVVLRSTFMPIVLQRHKMELVDTNMNSYVVPFYQLSIFARTANPLLYYLAVVGLHDMLRYFKLEDIITVTEEETFDDEWICFKSGDHMYVSVIREFFMNDLFVKHIVYGIIQAITNNNIYPKTITRKSSSDADVPKFKHLDDIDFWTKRLGHIFIDTDKVDTKFNKGKNVLVSFNRLLDLTTKEKLKLIEYNKRNIFAVLRWMMQNFSELNTKDNLDLKNKRFRSAEYEAYYHSRDIAVRANKLLSIEDPPLSDYENLIKLQPDNLIKKLYSSAKVNGVSKSPVLKYDDSTNDNDVKVACAFISKGPGTMGESSSKSIPIEARGIHPSHVGNLDINTSGTSEPGISGMLSPFGKTYNGFFDLTPEPQVWEQNFKRMYKEYFGAEYKRKPLSYRPKILTFDDFDGIVQGLNKLNKQTHKRELVFKKVVRE